MKEHFPRRKLYSYNVLDYSFIVKNSLNYLSGADYFH
jgi:hypothetical protein